MREAKSAVTEVNINGTLRYRVSYPTLAGLKRQHYIDKDKAENRLKEILGEKKNFALSAAVISSIAPADCQPLLDCVASANAPRSAHH